MKRILSAIILYLGFNTFLYSQSSNDCEFIYQIDMKASPVETANSDKYVVFNWDFSKIKEAKIEIEILPISDCYKNENAKIFNPMIIVNIDDVENKLLGLKKILHTDMMAKCFKWRVFINKPNCQKVSSWQYHSFIESKAKSTSLNKAQITLPK